MRSVTASHAEVADLATGRRRWADLASQPAGGRQRGFGLEGAQRLTKISQGISQLSSFRMREPAMEVVDHADELPAKVTDSGHLDLEGEGIRVLTGCIR